MFFFNKKKKEKQVPPKKQDVPASQPNKSPDIKQQFRAIYEPHYLEGYHLPPRELDSLISLDIIAPNMRQQAYDTDVKRVTDHLAGAKAAAELITRNLIQELAPKSQIDPRMFLAAYGSLGGMEAVRGIMEVVGEMADVPKAEKPEKMVKILNELNTSIYREGDSYHLFGEKIDELLTLFGYIMFNEELFPKFQSVHPQHVNQLGDLLGKPEYWEIPKELCYGINPKQFVNKLANCLEVPFAVYCRHPQERLLAIAIAANSFMRFALESKAITAEQAIEITLSYLVRTGHLISPEMLHTYGSEGKPAASVTGADLPYLFMRMYAPYLVNVKEAPRTPEQLTHIDIKHPEMKALTAAFDQQRLENPIAGAKVAAQEISTNLKNMLKNEGTVHTETYLGLLAALGGRLIATGIMNTMQALVSDDAPDRQKVFYLLAGTLDIMIIETQQGSTYLMGDRVARECTLFLENATGEKIDVETIKALAAKTAEAAGKSHYWDTNYNAQLKKNPKELADLMEHKFDPIFDIYCRYPQERILAVAFAIQGALREMVKQGALTKEYAITLISEIMWRVAHCWHEEEQP